MHHIIEVFDHMQYLILSAELISNFLDSLQSNFLQSFAILRLEDVAWVRDVVPKQPEPMMRVML